MTNPTDSDWNLESWRSNARLRLALLLGLHILMCCLSLIFVAAFYPRLQVVMFDTTHLFEAALNVALFATVSAVFIFGRFSFGYFLGFYFYTMILGYLWIVEFSRFHYDHGLSAVSAFAAAVAFLAPALFIDSPIRQRFVLSVRALDRLLTVILMVSAAVVATGAFHHFRLVGVENIYNFRDEIEFPAWLRYATGATSNTLLPFAFACFVARGERWRAAIALLLLVLFYPVTLTKLVLFAPFWLMFLVLLSRFVEARISVVLSLLLPLLVGNLLGLPVEAGAFPYERVMYYFGSINFRMIAFPSVALDVYSDFFSTHAHTYFCQISFLKPFVGCPYDEYLSIVMEKAYQLGNLNASLFATEGVASVGPMLAPLAALACGLVIALGNRLSSGLPARFILLSGGLFPQIMLNVPLTTTLLTNGAALLFLLWYVTPRALFDGSAAMPVEPSP
jgi:hypothetical protein